MIKKIFILLTLISLHTIARPHTIYEGYDDYYRTLNNTLFKNGSAHALTNNKNNVVKWHSHQFNLARARAFPGEFVINDDLGSRPLIYETSSLICIEGATSSSSGTSVRYKSVYLIDIKKINDVKPFKLPSLFASCLAIRLDDKNRVLFYRATYNYEGGSEIPTGTILTEYAIDGNHFKATGNSTIANFIDKENVWKFTIR